MKRVIFAFVIMIGFCAGVFANIHLPSVSKLPIGEQLLETFKKTFPNAEQVQWQELADRYTVNFKENDVITKIEYDKEGNFTNSVRYYFENHLPVNLVCKLHRKFPGQHVYGVTEMTTDAAVEYYITLEGEKTWIKVRANAESSMEVVEKYRKIP